MKRWSPGFAYVIGLITADGCLSKDGRHIDFTSKDLLLVEAFKKILGLKNKIGFKGKGTYPKGQYYRIQFGEVKFYRFLLGIGLTPKKSKTISALDIPDRYFVDFLRGYFDGDGFSYSYWDKRWKSSYMLYIGFASASRSYLIWLRDKIKVAWSIEGRIRACGKTALQLAYAKKSSILLFKKMYYKDDIPCLERKRFKIMRSLGIIELLPGC